jgi:predicted DNA-binding transcriptional regulator AlpA
MTTTLDRLVCEREAAGLLGLKNHATLSVWRCVKRYPALRYVRVGKAIRYRVSDIEAFLRSRTVGTVAQ